jgi:hypothetical protein
MSNSGPKIDERITDYLRLCLVSRVLPGVGRECGTIGPVK